MTTAQEPVVTEFLDSFDRLAQAIRRARGARSPSEQALTLSQFSLLQPLLAGASARVSELAEEAGVAPSTATRILDALQRRGIVARARSERDRRAVTVTLTELGRVSLRRHEEWMRQRQRAFYATLPAAERELTPDVLIRLAALIDELAVGPA